MAGFAPLLFGGSVYAFMGAWDMFPGSGYDDSGQSLALGYDATGAPYVIVSSQSVSDSTHRGNVNRIGWQKDTVWNEYASGVDAYDTVLDSSGNTYVVFRSSSGTAVTTLAKFDTSGTLVWQRKLSTTSSVNGSKLGVDGSDNLYVAGMFNSSQSAFLVKYNSSGTLQWQRKLTLTTYYNAYDIYSISVSSAGNVVLGYGAYYNDGLSAGGSAIVAKYNSSGTIQWQKNLSPGYDVGAHTAAVVQDVNGNIYAVASFDDASIRIIKINSSGTLQWNKWTTLSGVTSGNGVIDANGYIYFAIGNIIKVDSSGNIQFSRWLTQNNGAGVSGVYVRGMAVDTFDFMWLTGSVLGSGGVFTPHNTLLMRTPTSGTLVGTYTLPTSPNNAVAYTDAGLSFSSSSETLSTFSFTDAAGTLTDAAGALTFSAFSDTAYTVDM